MAKDKATPTAPVATEATAPAPVAEAPKPAPEPKTPITKVVVVIEGQEGFTVEGDADKVQREARRRIRAHGLSVKNAVETTDGGTRTISFAGEAAAAYKAKAAKAAKAPKAEPNGTAPADKVAAQAAAPVTTEAPAVVLEGQADANINSDEVEYRDEDEEAGDGETKDEESWD